MQLGFSSNSIQRSNFLKKLELTNFKFDKKIQQWGNFALNLKKKIPIEGGKMLITNC